MSERGSAMEEPTDFSPGKALIIEDRRDNIVFIANKVLKPDGWEIITARDGELGLQKALEEKPDLIITDLKLPKLHGLDVIEELNKRGVNIPTIVMTFHGSEETAIRAFRLGAVDYLIKPFKIEEILAAIDRALHKGRTVATDDSDLAQKLASQQQEIERLKSALQKKEQPLQRLQPPDVQAGGDAAHWQALLEEKDAALTTLKKQTTAQFRAMSQEINELRIQLSEKEKLVTSLQSQIDEGASQSDGKPAQGGDETTLAQAKKLVKSLTRAAGAQKEVIEKHRDDAEQLAQDLHRLATSIQMMGQSLADQADHLTSVLPKDG
jgi:DNA-binding response OmpR family regulator